LGSEIDALDRSIIALLQRDGKTSNVDIAQALGVAEATVRKRIDRLIADGVMRVVAVPDVEKLGLPVQTVIMVRVDLGQATRVADRLATMKQVRTVKYTTGEYDIVVEAAFAGDGDLLEFLTGRLAAIPGIRATATSHVLKTIKPSSEWILPRSGPPIILIVDDDPDFVEATTMVLEHECYRVVSAANGEQGLRAMRREQPDLVILDVMMSGVLDGLDASRRMRQEQGVRSTPVLMISSITSSDYAAMFPTDEYIPVDGFLSKPVGPQQMIEEVKRLLAE
jgi:Lrp/AsnC family transcriptional regulator for asnA, asnC and gidA